MYKSKRFLSDDLAVSAVIGTILMIAATVVLGGVIYAAVNGFGAKDTETGPETAWKATSFSTSQGGPADAIKITYLSGPELDDDAVDFTLKEIGGTSTTLADDLNDVASWAPGAFEVVELTEGKTYVVTITVLGKVTLDQTITL